jgi:hypothetical protein
MNKSKRILFLFAFLLLFNPRPTKPVFFESLFAGSLIVLLSPAWLRILNASANSVMTADPEAGKDYKKSFDRITENIEERQEIDKDVETDIKKTREIINDICERFPNVPNPLPSHAFGMPIKKHQDHIDESLNRRTEWYEKFKPLETEIKQLDQAIDELRGASTGLIYLHKTTYCGSLLVGAYLGHKIYTNYLSDLFATGQPTTTKLMNEITKLEFRLERLSSSAQHDTLAIKKEITKLENSLNKLRAELNCMSTQLSPSHQAQTKITMRNAFAAITYLTTLTGSALLSQAILYRSLFCAIIPPGKLLNEEEKSKIKNLKESFTTKTENHKKYLGEYNRENAIYNKLKVEPKPHAEANSAIPHEVREAIDRETKHLMDQEKNKTKNTKNKKESEEDFEELKIRKNDEKSAILLNQAGHLRIG